MSYTYKLNIYTGLMDKVYRVAPDIVNPSVSLTSPQFGYYIMGESIWPINLAALTTKATYDIEKVEFSRWWSLINTVDPATPGGGTENYADAWPFTTNQTWQARVYDDHWLSANSNVWSIIFQNYLFRGMDGNDTIDEGQIEALEDSLAKASFPWVYSFASVLDEYKYFARPTRLWQPSDPTLDFTDNGTGFPIPFQLQSWAVAITNWFWFTEDYYVYRSVNKLWGAMVIKVQP